MKILGTFDTASELFIMTEREEQAKIWFNNLTKLISCRSTVKRTNSNVISRQTGASTPTSLTSNSTPSRAFHFGGS